MSADNGIFVLTSPKNSELEYRVVHGFASDNLDYYPSGSHQSQAMEVILFHHSKIFTSKEDVMKEAIKLYDEIGWTEYGICFLDKRTNEFPSISVEEANKILNIQQ